MDAFSKSEYKDAYAGWSATYTKIEDDDCRCWRFNINKAINKCKCVTKKYFGNETALRESIRNISQNYRALLELEKERSMYSKVRRMPCASPRLECHSMGRVENPLINRCEEKCKAPVRNKDHPVCQEIKDGQQQGKQACPCCKKDDQEEQKADDCCCCYCCQPDTCRKCPNAYVDNSQREDFLQLQLEQQCQPEKYCVKNKKKVYTRCANRKSARVEDLQRRPFTSGCSDIPLDQKFHQFMTTPDIFKLRYMQNEYMSVDDWYTVP